MEDAFTREELAFETLNVKDVAMKWIVYDDGPSLLSRGNLLAGLESEASRFALLESRFLLAFC